MALHWLIPTWVVRFLRQIDGLSVKVDEQRTLLSISVNGGNEQLFRVRYMPLLSRESAEKQLPVLEHEAEKPLFAIPRLAPNTRDYLSTRRISWIESDTGVCHLSAPGILVHTVLRDKGVVADPEFARGKLIDRSGLIAEVILTFPFDQDLRLPAITHRANVSSGLVSRILGRLSSLNILAQDGTGPRRFWRLRDPGALLELWGAEERRPEKTTGLYVWSRSPGDLAAKLPRLDEVNIRWAVSGVSAANLYAPTLSTTPDPTVWVDSSQPVEHVASLLGGEIVDKGANLQVWQSPGNFPLQNAQTWIPNTGQKVTASPGNLKVISAPRAYIESASLPGRAPEVAQNLRERIMAKHG